MGRGRNVLVERMTAANRRAALDDQFLRLLAGQFLDVTDLERLQPRGKIEAVLAERAELRVLVDIRAVVRGRCGDGGARAIRFRLARAVGWAATSCREAARCG